MSADTGARLVCRSADQHGQPLGPIRIGRRILIPANVIIGDVQAFERAGALDADALSQKVRRRSDVRHLVAGNPRRERCQHLDASEARVLDCRATNTNDDVTTYVPVHRAYHSNARDRYVRVIDQRRHVKHLIVFNR